MMKKMITKSALIATVSLLLLIVLTEVTDAARARTGPRTELAPRSVPATGAKPDATANTVVYPQECPCCKWGYSGPFFLCQMICCKV